MYKKVLIFVLLISIVNISLLSALSTQSERKDDFQVIEIYDQDILLRAAEKKENEKRKQESKDEDLRNAFIGCIILTKTKFYKEETIAKSVIEGYSPEQTIQGKLYYKIRAILLQNCYSYLAVHKTDSFKLLSDIKNPTFNYIEYDYVYGAFTWEEQALKEESDLDLSTEQRQYIKYADDFEKMMMDKNRQAGPGTGPGEQQNASSSKQGDSANNQQQQQEQSQSNAN